MTRPICTTKAKAIVPFERHEQEALVSYLEFLGVRLFAVPNGARLRPRTAVRMKAEGMRAGAPDLVLMDRAPADGRPVAVEMKRRAGGTVSPEQKQAHEAMRQRGWHVVVGKGAEDAISQLASLGFKPGWRAGREPDGAGRC